MADEIVETTESSEDNFDPFLLESILDCIKKMLGLSPDYDAFDVDIIIHINSAFFTLYQLGIGTRPVFSISDNTKKWVDFSDDSSIISGVKQYIYLKVRMAFDPPTATSVLNQYSAAIQELEWRLREIADGIFDEESEEPEVPDNPSDEPIEPDTPTTPGECGCPEIATDEEVDKILDNVFGDSSIPPGSDVPVAPGECSCPDIATDEEVKKVLDDAFGDDPIASNEEVETILDNIFGG